MSTKTRTEFFGHTLRATALVCLGLSAQSIALAGESNDDDGVILSFSTVGDSRQDPTGADPTTLPLSGQDAKFLQNTKPGRASFARWKINNRISCFLTAT